MFNVLTCEHEAYADDLKLYKKIHSRIDQTILQENLKICGDWCQVNQLQMNSEKCYHIQISRQRNTFVTEYELDGRILVKVNEILDLGVVVDSSLKFDKHIDGLVRKANKMLGFLMRTCKKFTSLESIISLYNALVRPNLEYCSSVWSPMYSVYIEKIESVQHAFTRYVYRKFNYPYEQYEERIMRLEMTSLENRRLMNDTFVLHKILHANILTSLMDDIYIKINFSNLRNCKLFELPTPRTNLGMNAPLYRLCNDYNEQFMNVDIFQSYNVYRREILSIFN